jgi:phosphoribosylglycinamide formyltransferase-1
MFSIAVLISGNGSNLQAIIDAINKHQWPINIAAVISDQANAYGLQRAKQAEIATHVVPKQDYPNRETYDQALQYLLENIKPDLIVLAGFMRILTINFVTHFYGRLINIHPSLLPDYKGLNTHQRVLCAGEQYHGITVHYVSPELDNGPAIAQMQLEINPAESAEQLQQRIHVLEHQLYPAVIYWFAAKRLQLTADGVKFDQQLIAKTGMQVNKEMLAC